MRCFNSRNLPRPACGGREGCGRFDAWRSHDADLNVDALALQVSIPGMEVVSCLLSGPFVCPGPSGQLRAGRQDGQGNRHDEERRHVTCQVPHLPRLGDRLDGHDCSVYGARPHGEPDQAQIG